jgi:hypothetical protein
VLSGAEPSLGVKVSQYSVEGFVRVFVAVAAMFAISLTGILLLDEKPLETRHT